MFNITACKLTVADGKMTAVMTMGGKGYRLSLIHIYSLKYNAEIELGGFFGSSKIKK